MALRAFLFSADGTATSELCQVLTELGIEAELCSEMLLAVERITKEPFDALIVDWDQQTDAIFLLKSVRDLKSAAHLLTLALVKDDSHLPEALQAGANSAIRKPIDPHQAHDTLSTAKQLIEARRSEHKDREARLTAAPPPPSGPDEADLYGHEDDSNSTKPGFLQQTAPRSALEAVEAVVPPEPPPEPDPAPSPAADPEVRARAMAILGYGPKPEAPKPNISRPSPKVIDFSGNASAAAPRDSGGVFSSAPDPVLADSEEIPESRPRYGLYAGMVAVFVAAVLWAFAPGDSYFARLKRFELKHSRPASPAAQTVPVEAQPSHEAPATAKPEPVEPDPEIADAQQDAASNVQVIENKPIPPAGAQQPPSPDPQPTLATGQSPNAQAAQAVQAQPDAAPGNPPGTSQPTIQSVSAPVAPPSSTDPSAPVTTPSSPAPSTPSAGNPAAPPVPTSHVPDEGFAANPNPNSGVIIPDSLKTAPAPAPASNLEPPMVPEETSRVLVVKRVDPQYPPLAIQQRLDGPVVLQVIVNKDGSIRDVKLVRGYFVLGRAAFDAVKQWRYKPYAPNGKAIDFQTNVTVNFKFPG